MPDRPPDSEEPAADRPPSDVRPEEARPKQGRSFLAEFARILVAALAVALLLKTFVVQAFFIPSTSMVPTLRVGDRVLVNKLVYTFGDIQRFDVVVFRDPRDTEDRGPIGTVLDWLTEGLGLAQPEHQDFIKRVLAFPGETWEIRGGRLFIDGREMAEPYLKQPPDTRSFPLETVPAGKLFVLGDNRLSSEDSRFPALGYVPVENVVGKAFVIVWPPSRLGWIRTS